MRLGPSFAQSFPMPAGSPVPMRQASSSVRVATSGIGAAAAAPPPAGNPARRCNGRCRAAGVGSRAGRACRRLLLESTSGDGRVRETTARRLVAPSLLRLQPPSLLGAVTPALGGWGRGVRPRTCAGRALGGSPSGPRVRPRSQVDPIGRARNGPAASLRRAGAHATVVRQRRGTWQWPRAPVLNPRPVQRIRHPLRKRGSPELGTGWGSQNGYGRRIKRRRGEAGRRGGGVCEYLQHAMGQTSSVDSHTRPVEPSAPGAEPEGGRAASKVPRRRQAAEPATLIIE